MLNFAFYENKYINFKTRAAEKINSIQPEKLFNRHMKFHSQRQLFLVGPKSRTCTKHPTHTLVN